MTTTTGAERSPLFDSDTHYYEAEDAFLRYLDPALKHKAPRWVRIEDNGQRRLLFADRMNRFMGADQTFARVGKPGVLRQKGPGDREAYGELEECRPEFRVREARLQWMDEQGVEAALLFPTLALSVEQLIADDVVATYGNLRAFNRWLDEDWGFNHQERIYAVPLVSLLDPFRAVEELEFVLGRGARVLALRAGPIAGHSPADPIYDRFWTVATDATAAVVFHATDDGYRHKMARLWGWGNVNIPARNIPPLQHIIAGNDRSIHDTLAVLLYERLFERFPSVRIGTIELGMSWVPELLHNLEKYGQGDLAEHPVDTFRRHVWVNPFETEDIAGLATMIGTDRIMFGSDYPHTDGLAEPAAYKDALESFDEDARRRIMYDNASALVRGSRALSAGP
jgi:predicted TIM-barrel fold metal-dependent hydrolase